MFWICTYPCMYVVYIAWKGAKDRTVWSSNCIGCVRHTHAHKSNEIEYKSSEWIWYWCVAHYCVYVYTRARTSKRKDMEREREKEKKNGIKCQTRNMLDRAQYKYHSYTHTYRQHTAIYVYSVGAYNCVYVFRQSATTHRQTCGEMAKIFHAVWEPHRNSTKEEKSNPKKKIKLAQKKVEH